MRQNYGFRYRGGWTMLTPDPPEPDAEKLYVVKLGELAPGTAFHRDTFDRDLYVLADGPIPLESFRDGARDEREVVILLNTTRSTIHAVYGHKGVQVYVPGK
jgi:hypothetical protein